MVLPRREGIDNGHNAVYRIYREENLGVKRMKWRKRAADTRTTPEPAKRLNERWPIDFVTDHLETGRAFCGLTPIDQYSQECPILEPGSSLSGRAVVECLERVATEGPLPESITVGNRGEFAGRALCTRAYCHHVKLDFIRPESPSRMASSQDSMGNGAVSASTQKPSSA
jgi:putative transposase